MKKSWKDVVEWFRVEPHAHRIWIAVLCLVFSYSLNLKTRLVPLAPGLDYSFVYAYNWPSVTGLRWGKEVVSTYGPFGFLIHTMDIGHNFRWSQIFSLALPALIAASAVLFAFSRKYIYSYQTILAALAVIYGISFQIEEWVLFGIFITLSFTAISLDKKPRLIIFTTLGFVASILLLVKFSLGIGAVIVLCSAIVFDKNIRRSCLSASAGLVGGLIGISFSILILKTDTLPYYLAGYQVSKGFSSAMSLALPTSRIAAISFLVFFITILLWIVLVRAKNWLQAAGIVVASLFIGWKYGIVRQDDHIIALALLAGLCAIFVFIETLGKAKGRLSKYLYFGSICALGLLIVGVVENHSNSSLVQAQLIPGHNLQQGLLSYIKPDSFRSKLAAQGATNLASSTLPTSAKDLIGTSSVDTYPWESSIIPANNLNWATRPLAGSFSTYTPVLDTLNANFFDSNAAPSYLLWHHDVGVKSIDERHVFFDEPKTLRQIFNHYDLAADSPLAFILKYNPADKLTIKKTSPAQKLIWNKVYNLNDAEFQDLRLTIQPNLILDFTVATYRLDPIFIVVHYSDDAIVKYRVVPDNLIDGIQLNPLPRNTVELSNMFNHKSIPKVTSFMFTSSPLIVKNSSLSDMYIDEYESAR